jgi:ribonuclease Z
MDSTPQLSSREKRINSLFPRYSDMDLTFLGTGSGVPSLRRGVSAICLRFQGDVWLFDCGESTQLQLQKSAIRPSKIRKIFITHLHGDHVFGIAGTLCQLGSSMTDLNYHDEVQPIDIYGPEGTRYLINSIIQLTQSKIVAPFRVHELIGIPNFSKERENTKPPYKYISSHCTYNELRDFKDISPTVDSENRYTYDICSTADLHIQAAPMHHSIPCVGYVVTEKARPGKLHIDKVQPIVNKNRELLQDVKGLRRNVDKIFSIIKNLNPDESYLFPDGTVIYGRDVVSPEIKGRKVVIMGDTCSGNSIVHIANGADVLVHEATNAWMRDGVVDDRYPSYNALKKDTVQHGHSTPQMAGEFAKRIGAKHLILTHFSQRYPGDDSEKSMEIMKIIENMAAESAGFRPNGDNVIAAWDFMNIGIDRLDDTS